MMEQKTVLVIFGGTGDLAKRKLIPAIYNLCYENLQQFREPIWSIVGIGRKEITTEEYVKEMGDWVRQFARKEVKEDILCSFLKQVKYYQMDLTKVEEYRGLHTYLKKEYENQERIYYYAVAPQLFETISTGICSVREGNNLGKVIIEKPFGQSLEQAKQHFSCITKAMGEENVFAIDHYLGKEMIQNIYTLRFGNVLFEKAWNHQSIGSIEITTSEELGIGQRGAYYDKAGAMRDMVQNHLFQILSLLTMEKPGEEKDLVQEQSKVLGSLRYPTRETVEQMACFGQYEGYKNEPKIEEDSRTETYAALAIHIDNDRWRDVPIFIRTGKKLKRRSTFVVINFLPTMANLAPNQLRIEIQPEEGVRFNFNIKQPGLLNQVETVSMNFCQSCQLEAHMNTPEAYERLLMAARQGQSQLFSKWSQIEVSWKWVDALMKLKEELNLPVYSYVPMSDGPKEANNLWRRYEGQFSPLETKSF